MFEWWSALPRMLPWAGYILPFQGIGILLIRRAARRVRTYVFALNIRDARTGQAQEPAPTGYRFIPS